MRRRGPEIGRARPFERAEALDTTQVPSSGVQLRRRRQRQDGEDAASAAPTLRVVLRERPPLTAVGEAWEERVAEQSSIRRQRTVTLLPSVIVAPEPPPPPPPPPPPVSARAPSNPAIVRERLERMAPTQCSPRANAVITTKTTSMAGLKPSTVIVLLVISIAVFAIGVTTLLLTTTPIG